ncbi:hypothetical protein [Actinokineospora sp.]|uniref:hypothetical protein n=1 Tax=Actinokineospora sp. TaxID=1872133 RepID=UPI003D6B6ED4
MTAPTPPVEGTEPGSPGEQAQAPETTPPANGSEPAPVSGDQTSTGGSADVDTLRAEVAEWRTKVDSAQQSIVDKIAAALGIAETGETPTVEQVTEQLTAAQRDARERAVDLAVYRAAPTAGADPDALLDSTTFRRRVADLDPGADGFGDKVAAAIAEAVKANPRLASTPAAAPRSGGQISGGSPTGDDLGSLSVEDYIKRTRKRGN